MRIARSHTSVDSSAAEVPDAVLAATQATAGADSSASRAGSARGLGQLSGLLPRDHLTEGSALQVDLSRETVRLPLYKGKAHGKTVWFMLLDASDRGLADDLGVNFAPRLLNLGIGCRRCIEPVTMQSTTPQQNRFGQAVVDFQDAPDFSPTRVAVPGPQGFPLKKFQPGAIGGGRYSPFISIAGSPVVYNAPVAATGNDPFDVDHHRNTADRGLGIHIATPAPAGKYYDSWLDPPDRREPGLQRRRDSPRPVDRSQSDDRQTRPVRLGRRGHQLGRHRLHGESSYGQPGCSGPIPATLTRRHTPPAIAPVQLGLANRHGPAALPFSADVGVLQNRSHLAAQCHQINKRGLSENTVLQRQSTARRFVQEQAIHDGVLPPDV